MSVSLRLVILSVPTRSYFFLTNGKILGKCLFRAGPNMLLAFFNDSRAAINTDLLELFKHFWKI